jgi:hypothetical protein
MEEAVALAGVEEEGQRQVEERPEAKSLETPLGWVPNDGLAKFPVGGRLAGFFPKWVEFGCSSDVLSHVRGITLDFWKEPPVSTAPVWTPIPLLPEKQLAMEREIKSLLEKRVIFPLSQSCLPGFWSRMFLTPKPKPGEWRPILNLKTLNKFLYRKTFKMDTLSFLRSCLRHGLYATSIDLKDAYLHLAVAEQHQIYLRFSYNGISYQFRAMPFGLTSAPRIFTEVVKEVAAYLRRTKNIVMYVYLDDWLIVNPDPYLLQEQTAQVLDFVEGLGWIVNREKSDLVPSQNPVYLGAVIDFRMARFFPTVKRLEALELTVQDILHQPSVPVICWVRMLGHMASMTEMVPFCRLRMRPLQWYVKAFWKPSSRNMLTEIPLRVEVQEHLSWWLDRKNTKQGLPFPAWEPDMVLFSDASDWGWGATLRLRGQQEDWMTQGKWTDQERSLSINLRELRAVRLALQTWQSLVEGKKVLVNTDNTTALSHINREGGTHSPQLFKEAWQLFLWAISSKIALRAIHVPGVQNIRADWLSRRRLSSIEWSLNQRVVDRMFTTLGQAQMDLFASSLNAKTLVYCSYTRDPQAYCQDAFSIPWTGFLGYAYPPFSLIPGVLRKVRMEKAELILVAPRWPRQAWFSLLLDLLVDFPRTLPVLQDLLYLGNRTMPMRNQDLLKLTVWRLSGNPARVRDFQMRQQNWQESQGESQLSLCTIQGSVGSADGVQRRKWIPVLPLLE